MKKSYFLLLAFFFTLNIFAQNSERKHSHADISQKFFADKTSAQIAEEFCKVNKIKHPEEFYHFLSKSVKLFSVDIYSVSSKNLSALLQGKESLVLAEFSKFVKQKEALQQKSADPWVAPLACGSACTNPDFEMGDFTAWEGSEGTASTGANPNWTANTFNQASIVGVGADPLVPGLQMVNPNGGGSFAARVGDQAIGGLAGRLSLSFTVTSANTNFTYSYAVVLEDPVSGHTQSESPYFKLQLRDQNGSVLACGSYQEFGGTGISGYTQSPGSNYWYRDWTSVFVDLTPYIGQCVTLEFITQDCTLGGHLGYAYVDASCSPAQVLTSSPSVCGSNLVTLTAPAGAPSYNWSGPGIVGSNTGQTVTVNQGGTYSVVMASLSGCSTTLNITLGSAPASPQAIFSSNSPCLGNSAVFTDSSTPTGGSITVWNWDFNNDGVYDTTGQNMSHLFNSAGTFPVNLQVQWGQCYHDTTVSVTVNPGSIAAFSSQPVCQNNATSFTNTSTGTSFQWDFGEPSSGANNSSTAQSPSHTYSTSGTFNVQLIVGTGICPDTMVSTVVVNPLPVATFSSTTVCQGLPTSFTDQSSVATGNTLTSWSWNFDDPNSGAANISTDQSPTHQYTAAGSFNVILTVTTNNSCQSTTTIPVTVSSEPVATFTGTNVCESSATSFTNTSASALSYFWEFGDANTSDTSSAANPTYIYSSPGNYTVTFIAINGSCYDTASSIVTVYPKPVAGFSATTVCEGQLTAFTDNSSILSPDAISTWSYDFGDGSLPDTTQNPTYTYASNGTYNSVLTITSNNNCSSSVSIPVIVNVQPTAAFSTTNVCSYSQAIFVDQSVDGVTNTWNFGDSPGTSVVVGNATHQYGAEGTYLVSQLVSTPEGCWDTASMSIVIHPAPQANFSVNGVCLNVASAFSDLTTLSSGTIASWAWNFGDGSAGSSLQNPSHTYASAGTYVVELISTSDNNCVDTFSINAPVYPLPQAAFTVAPVCQGVSSIFDDNSTVDSGTVTSWEWDLSTGVSNIQNPTTVYPTDGSYNVTLVVGTENNCKDTLVQQAIVYALPVVQFTADTMVGCMPLCVNFIDQSTVNNSSLVAWSWNFGDNSGLNNAQSPDHCFTEAQSYDITLKTISADGCETTLTVPQMITVWPLPTAAYSVAPQPTTILAPAITFTDASEDAVQWFWDFGDGSTMGGNDNNPTHLYPDSGANSYMSNLIVLNQYGCSDTAYVPVEIGPDFTFFIPNAFTPNADGKNDGFLGMGVGIDKYEMWIYDRWGNMLWTSQDLYEPWPGVVRGQSDICQQDVYVWVVNLVDVFGKKHRYVGHVTLIK